MTQKSKMEQTLADIVDVFAGGDGGVRYFNFRCLITDMEKKAAAGDPDAMKICDVVFQFKRLIDVASTR